MSTAPQRVDPQNPKNPQDPQDPKARKAAPQSKITLICPVSGKRVSIPYALEGQGVFLPCDEADPMDLPIGWGRLVIDVVVPNSEIEAVRIVRDEEVRAAIDQLRNVLASTDRLIAGAAADQERAALQMQRSAVQAELDSGRAKLDAQKIIEDKHPMPAEATSLLRLQFQVLSDEAMGAALRALRDAGFPIEAPQ